MHLHRPFLAILLALSLAACAAPNTPPDALAAEGTYLIAHQTVDNDHPNRVRIGGITFQITPDQITWNRGNALPLPAGWGLLELVESPTSIALNLDGVIVKEFPK